MNQAITRVYGIILQNNALDQVNAFAMQQRNQANSLAREIDMFRLAPSPLVTSYGHHAMRLFWIILFLSLCPYALAAELHVGGFVVAPFVMANGGGLEGLLVEFIKTEIQPQLPWPIKWEAPVSLERSVASLASGSLDIVLIMPGTLDGNTKYGLFKWAFLQVQPHLAVRPDSALYDLSDLHQLCGMRLGWTGSGRADVISLFESYGAYVEKTTNQTWQQSNLRKLAAGRLDGAFFLNPYSPQFVAGQERIPIRLLPLPMPVESFRMAYSLKTDKEVVARFEQAALKAFSAPKFKALLREYLQLQPPKASAVTPSPVSQSHGPQVHKSCRVR
ncbi:substrate-binding periplasmic protein [Duganella sp. Dugasp56]|uniref:substrate-binding periplasmic protein n=1 Tax=Duganella sp. Dugasp56 TaxID=3243046 RepID=UPI0039B054D3